MCGINVAGERRFLIEPKVGGSITHAACEYDSVYGTVSSSWRRTQTGVEYSVTVPANTEACVVIGGEERILSPGEYVINCLN